MQSLTELLVCLLSVASCIQTLCMAQSGCAPSVVWMELRLASVAFLLSQGFCLKGQLAHFRLKYKDKLMTETMGMIGEFQHECSPEAWPDTISHFAHYILVLQLCG